MDTTCQIFRAIWKPLILADVIQLSLLLYRRKVIHFLEDDGPSQALMMKDEIQDEDARYDN